jgi:hypothetical protein
MLLFEKVYYRELIMANDTMGPNMRRLVAERAAQVAVESCKDEDLFGHIVQRIVSETLGKDLAEAKAWCETAVGLVRQAAEPNPWKAATDEEIAGTILRKIAGRRKNYRRKIGLYER